MKAPRVIPVLRGRGGSNPEVVGSITIYGPPYDEDVPYKDPLKHFTLAVMDSIKEGEPSPYV